MESKVFSVFVEPAETKSHHGGAQAEGSAQEESQRHQQERRLPDKGAGPGAEQVHLKTVKVVFLNHSRIFCDGYLRALAIL